MDKFNDQGLHNIDLNFFSLVCEKGLTLKDSSVSFFINNSIDDLQVLEKLLFFSHGIIFEEFFNMDIAVKFLLKFFNTVKGLFVAKDYTFICLKAQEIADALINAASKHNDLNIINIEQSYKFLKPFRLFFEKISLKFFEELTDYLTVNNIIFEQLIFSEKFDFKLFLNFFEQINLNSKNLTDFEF